MATKTRKDLVKSPGSEQYPSKYTRRSRVGVGIGGFRTQDLATDVGVEELRTHATDLMKHGSREIQKVKSGAGYRTKRGTKGAGGAIKAIKKDVKTDLDYVEKALKFKAGQQDRANRKHLRNLPGYMPQDRKYNEY